MQAVGNNHQLNSYIRSWCPDHISRTLVGMLAQRTDERASGNLIEVIETAVAHDHGRKISVKLSIASDPRAPWQLLDYLADTDDVAVLERVAGNSNTATPTLARLVRNANPEVRQAVAENSAAPTPLLLELAHDENPDVRYRLAESYSCPIRVLYQLIEDENPYVKQRAEETCHRLLAEGAETPAVWFVSAA